MTSYFRGDRKTPWAVVAYGMIGASLSGVTFISVPGNVLAQNWYYLPMVIGFIAGYAFIAEVLLPIYYKKNLNSIYSYLGDRFGLYSNKTAAFFFMISRLLGAAVRIFVVIIVFMTFIPSSSISEMGLFTIVAAIFLLFLYLYTYRGGVKTIIWTDVLQTTFMLLAVFISIYFIVDKMDWSFNDMFKSIFNAENPLIPGVKLSTSIDLNSSSATNFIKQFISGAFVCIAMTGFDQTMMQKNLSCRDLKSAKKNMYSTSIIIFLVNLLFLALGIILTVYIFSNGGMDAFGISKTDQMFPKVVSSLGVGITVIFLIGLISATYPSAGGAMTSLTSSFCIDFLHFDKRADLSVHTKEKMRKFIQAIFALILLVIMCLLYILNNQAVIVLVYKLASYTYGPLLGIFFFGIFTNRDVNDKIIPWLAISSPILCFLLNYIFKTFIGFEFGFCLLIVNALLTFLGMFFISKPSNNICKIAE